ncbi:MAG: ABC transporter ATP-binding protein/permease [Endomicrobium sp.]|jgi:putative ATP-binding cassette transporter|nr:ABC transporter ATP-binding protein/permease [Endomicrobium sp.]
MKVVRSIFRLIKICLSTTEGKIGIIFYAAVFALNIVGIKVSLELINWNKHFYNALEKYDTQAAFHQVKLFALLVAISSLIYLVSQYLQKLLQIRWRKVLTEKALNMWLKDKNYWYLSSSDKSELDNPDQRIAEDCKTFIEHLTGTTQELLNRCIGLVTYTVVLWNIASYALSFTLFGMHITIPHYMVWAAPIYVAISSIVTHLLGVPLIKINVEQKRREADFRFSLTRFRESKEAVALQSGEKVEREIMDERFLKIIKNWRKLIKRDFILGCFTRPYMATILRIPVFLALPAYLFGKVTLGSMMQMSSAFQNVATSLSWFIFSYRDLASLAASSVRFDSFLNAAESFKYDYKQLSKRRNALGVKSLALYSPENKLLFSIDDANISKGDTVLVKGCSGKGKSTLFKTFAGLHHNYTGTVTVPENKSMFLPQKAYFPLGGLAHAVSYPNKLSEDKIPEIKEILQKVNFPYKDVEKRLMQYDMSQLSGGEQQRLVVARILFNKPEWIFMDESTNALDYESEKFLIELMQNELPDSTYVIVSHSDAVNEYAKNYYQLNLDAVQC